MQAVEGARPAAVRVTSLERRSRGSSVALDLAALDEAVDGAADRGEGQAERVGERA